MAIAAPSFTLKIRRISRAEYNIYKTLPEGNKKMAIAAPSFTVTFGRNSQAEYRKKTIGRPASPGANKKWR